MFYNLFLFSAGNLSAAYMHCMSQFGGQHIIPGLPLNFAPTNDQVSQPTEPTSTQSIGELHGSFSTLIIQHPPLQN